MVGIDRTTVLIVPWHIAAVRVPLDWAVVTFVADGHDVLWIEEEIEVALMVSLVMGDRSVWLLALPYQQLAAAVPLARASVPSSAARKKEPVMTTSSGGPGQFRAAAKASCGLSTAVSLGRASCG